jgi:hypothetical protein
MALPNSSANSGSTYLSVSIRKPSTIPFGYRMLIAADQCRADLGAAGDELLQRFEIAAAFTALALAAEGRVEAELVRPHGGMLGQPPIARRRRIRPVGDDLAVRAAPSNVIAALAPWSVACHRAVGQEIPEYIAGVVEDDIHDHVHAAGVRLVDQAPQFAVWIGSVGCKAGVDAQEMLDAVAVVGAVLFGAVLQDRTEPDGADAEPFEIVETLAHTVDRPTLESAERLVPRTAGQSGRIVEAIDQDEVDPAVAPIRG